jgi:hypothetical protein
VTPKEILDVLEFLAGAYPAWEITPRVASTYTIALADADGESIRVAALAYMRSGEKFFPPPGALLNHHKVLDAPTAEEAWGEVRASIDSGDPNWSHPRIDRAVRAALGGWSTFCRGALTSEMVSHRARFIDAYRGIEDRDHACQLHEDAKALIEGFPTLLGASGIGLIPPNSEIGKRSGEALDG